MSDDDFQDDEDQQDPNIRKLREKAKRADTLESENSTLAKELAVYKAGITGLNDRQVKALLNSIDGDLTSDSVKEAAAELGFITQQTEDPAISDEELDAMRKTADASVGGTPPNSGDATSRFEQRLDEAQTEEEWRAVMDEMGPELGMRRT